MSSGRRVVAIANASREIKLSELWDGEALASRIKLASAACDRSRQSPSRYFSFRHYCKKHILQHDGYNLFDAQCKL